MFGDAKMHRPGIRERFDLEGFQRQESHISQLDVCIHMPSGAAAPPCQKINKLF